MTALTIGTRFLSTTSEAEARTELVVIGHSLVHHIPCIDHVLITLDDGVNMVAQTLIEHLFRDGLAFLVSKHPVGKL